MDINDLRGLSTLFMLITFVGLVVWAYGRKQKKPFDDAANLPFADKDLVLLSFAFQKINGELGLLFNTLGGQQVEVHRLIRVLLEVSRLDPTLLR